MQSHLDICINIEQMYYSLELQTSVPHSRIITITGLAMLVSGVSLFLLVVFAGMAYPRVTQCVDMVIGESQCREFGARPPYLDPIMNETFVIGMLALAAGGSAMIGINQFKRNRSRI